MTASEIREQWNDLEAKHPLDAITQPVRQSLREWASQVSFAILSPRKEQKPYTKPRFWRDPFVK
jgi:hypothetical protein